jgi:hypothetical protein
LSRQSAISDAISEKRDKGLGVKYMAKAVEPPRRNIKPLTEKIDASKPGKPPGGSKTEREGVPADVQDKTFHWDVIADGNCFLRHAEVSIFSDGRCIFYGESSTTNAGDDWLIRGLAFIDVNGTELWRMPQFDGPVMVLADFDYIIYRNDLAIPPYIFPYVTSVTMYHHC